MVRSVSNDRPVNQPTSADKTKGSAPTQKAATPQQQPVTDSFGTADAMKAGVEGAALRMAAGDLGQDVAGLAQTLGALETFARTMTSEVKGKTMAQDVSLPSQSAQQSAAPMPMAVVSKALTLQEQAKNGKIVLSEQAKEIVKSLTQAAAQQLDTSMRQTVTLSSAQKAQMQSFTQTAREAFRQSGGSQGASAKKGGALDKAWSQMSTMFAEGDIDALAEMVMMECAHDHETDLKDILDKMRDGNEKKKALRSQITAEREALAKKKDELRAAYDASDDPKKPATFDDYMKGQLAFGDPAKPVSFEVQSEAIDGLQKQMDSLGDLTQELQLKLQMALDRRAKMYETLSAIMKKSAATGDAIIQNMK